LSGAPLLAKLELAWHGIEAAVAIGAASMKAVRRGAATTHAALYRCWAARR